MDTLYNPNIKVRFVIHNFETKCVQEITKFYEDSWNISDVEVEIKECSKVYIEFEARDEKASLIVENVFQEEGDPFVLFPGQGKMLFELDNNYSMLVPGSYAIKITVNNKELYSMFEIVPRHISDIQLKNLRVFVNSEISHLSYNMASRLQSTGYSEDIDYISIVKQYNEVYKILKLHLNSIMENPYLTIEKKYLKQRKNEKLDKKAVYINSKRQRNNEYSYKKVKDYYNKQNIIIKNIAMKMLNNIVDIEEKLSYAYKRNKIEEEIIRKESEVKRFSANKIREISLNNKEIKKRIKSYDQSILSLDSIEKRKGSLNEIILIIRGLKVTFLNFINSEYIKKIPTVYNINYKSIKLEDYRYKYILKVYNNIYLNKGQKSINYKPSEILYEYFVFLVVVKIFKDMGFTLSDCDFKEIIEGDFIDRIPKGCLARFLDGRKEVRVWYEKEILSLPRESISLANGFYTHAPNRLPDIRVDFLEDNIVKNSIIIESKYRRYSYLWNDYYNTETMIQIKNYKTTIKYVWDYNQKPISTIKKVIVVYPGEKNIEKLINKEWGDYTFLQLKPEENGEIHGFQDLKNIIENEII